VSCVRDHDKEEVDKDVEDLKRAILLGTQALVPVESDLDLHDSRDVHQQDGRHGAQTLDDRKVWVEQPRALVAQAGTSVDARQQVHPALVLLQLGLSYHLGHLIHLPRVMCKCICICVSVFTCVCAKDTSGLIACKTCL